MANQTLPLDVSYEMNKNETRQEKRDMSVEENLYSSSLDTPKELCSSSVPDTCGDDCSTTSNQYVEILEFTHFCRFFSFENIGPNQKEKVLYDRVTVVVAYRVDTRDTF